MKLFAFAFAYIMLGVTLVRADTKDMLLDSIGNMVKNAVKQSTTTVAPNVISEALSGGKDFVEQQVGAHKDEITHTIGDLAEKVGVNRIVAETVGAGLLNRGIEKGKELLSGYAVTEKAVNAKEEATAELNSNYAFNDGTKDGSAGNTVGDKSHAAGVEGGDNDLELPMVMKKVDLTKQGF